MNYFSMKTFLNLKEFTITETELKLIAKAATLRFQTSLKLLLIGNDLLALIFSLLPLYDV